MKKIIYYPMLLVLMLGLTTTLTAQTTFGVRLTLDDLNPNQRQELADLIIEYSDTKVIGTHAATMWNSGLTDEQRVHRNQNFLPFHRAYVAGLEDFLILKGKEEYVPLPKWAPETAIPGPFQQISPDCNDAYPGPSNDPDGTGYDCNNLVNVGANPNRSILSQFFQGVPNRIDFQNLCSYSKDDITGVGITPWAPPPPTSTTVRSIMEYPWHDFVHFDIGGVMGVGKSPGSAIFMPWHAYVDDVWKEWQCQCQGAPAVDLWMRDTPMHLADNPTDMATMSMDRGEEPNNESNLFYRSKDIWVRHTNDGDTTDVHQNPIYNGPNSPSYAYVRIRNRGCQTSSGGQVSLYWAKAGTHSGWPDVYQGQVFGGSNNDISMGGHVGTLSIPPIPAGGSTIVEFEYQPHNPLIFQEITENPASLWHSCLLAVIDAPSQNDPLVFPVPEAEFISYNNNVVLRNLSIVCTSCLIGTTGATVHVGNLGVNTPGVYNFELRSEAFEAKNIWKEAEITVQLSHNVWQKWIQAGGNAENIQIFNEEERKLLITGNNAILKQLAFGPNEWGTMHLNFNFLTEEVTDREEYMFNLIQTDIGTGKPVGGELFQILRDNQRGLFMAQGDASLQGNQMAFSANDINEPATYNWYDPEGNLIYTGKNALLSPEIAGEYKLEIIANIDGYKDYTDITVDAAPGADQIISLSPNPAATSLMVTYQINGASSAYLRLTPVQGGTVSSNYIITLTDTQITIDVSAYNTGQYVVQLVVDGQAIHYKHLLIE